jgi:hypothetical protein
VNSNESQVKKPEVIKIKKRGLLSLLLMENPQQPTQEDLKHQTIERIKTNLTIIKESTR